MAHDDKPLSYEGRIVDTKGTAQRLDLDYLKRPSRFRDLKRRLTWIAPAAAAVAILPFVLGVGQTRKVFSKGPVSRPHAVFENHCQACHAERFAAVSDRTCLQCHDGPAHPAKEIDTARIANLPACVECHVEHRGGALEEVADSNCAACHAQLSARAQGVKLRGAAITAFREGRHPDFGAAALADTRPLRLNHAAHMPAQPKTIRGFALPMKCADCHTAAGPDLAPVSFDRHCASCHRRELEFALPELRLDAPPAPHNRDPRAIRQFIRDTYKSLLDRDPSLASRPIGRELRPEPNAAVWLAKASARSEEYLFQKKCVYCHEYARVEDGLPVVKSVAPVSGHYTGKPEAEPWFARAEFHHRAHRAVACASCHTTARASAKTSDVLIPGMKSCVDCHASGAAGLDRCQQCHLYHNKSLEVARDGKPLQELLGGRRP